MQNRLLRHARRHQPGTLSIERFRKNEFTIRFLDTGKKNAKSNCPGEFHGMSHQCEDCLSNGSLTPASTRSNEVAIYIGNYSISHHQQEKSVKKIPAAFNAAGI
ncbi:MAG: hypothetical protein F7O42_09330 [Opitutae bacterium]|nr:hypothetical protein [Opitutae bacterium]